MTDQNCKRCQGSGFVWETVTSKVDGHTFNVMTWCPRCNAARRAEQKAGKSRSSKGKRRGERSK